MALSIYIIKDPSLGIARIVTQDPQPQGLQKATVHVPAGVLAEAAVRQLSVLSASLAGPQGDEAFVEVVID